MSERVFLLKCVNCGANLEIPDSVDFFACAYCSASQTVFNDGGIISLKLVEQKIEKIEGKLERTAVLSEINNLESKLDDLQIRRIKLIKLSEQRNEGLASGLLLVVGGIAFLVFLSIYSSVNEALAAFLIVPLFLFMFVALMISKVYKNRKRFFNPDESLDKVDNEIKTIKKEINSLKSKINLD